MAALWTAPAAEVPAANVKRAVRQRAGGGGAGSAAGPAGEEEVVLAGGVES